MVSVIIPCYNCEAYLARAIDSVLKQTYKSFEIILVNNNSTDSTQAVIDSYSKQFPQLISVYNEKMRGATYARNLGLSKARGYWLQFLDADDELHSNKLERQLTILKGKKIDILLGSFTRVNDQGKETFDHVNACDDLWKSFASSRLGITSSNLYRKEMVCSVGGWNIQLSSSQEYDLLLRCLRKGALISFDHDSSVYIHEVAGSISRNKDEEKIKRMLKEYIALRLELKTFLREQDLLSDDLNIFIDLCIYRTLMGRKAYCKDFVQETIKHAALNVNLFEKFKSEMIYRVRILFGIKS